MIFYTLHGPGYNLEIHDDKICLMKRSFWSWFSFKKTVMSWNIEELNQFEITSPNIFSWGRLEWKSFDGKTGSCRFFTDTAMVKKIEKYLQKKIVKNHERLGKSHELEHVSREQMNQLAA